MFEYDLFYFSLLLFSKALTPLFKTFYAPRLRKRDLDTECGLSSAGCRVWWNSPLVCRHARRSSRHSVCHPPPEATRRLPKTTARARATVNCSSPNSNWRSINIARAAAARLTHYLIEKAFNSRLIYRTLTSLQC